MNTDTNTSTGPGTPDPCAILSQRLFAAPRETVFRAFREPDRLARWWGPAGFRNTFDVFEFRPGGRWKFTMHGPDGTDYPNQSTFQAIEAPARIVFEHHPQPHFFMTITLTEEAGQTRIHWHMLFATAQIRDQIAVYALPGNEQNFDRLEVELATHP